MILYKNKILFYLVILINLLICQYDSFNYEFLKEKKLRLIKKINKNKNPKIHMKV